MGGLGEHEIAITRMQRGEPGRLWLLTAICAVVSKRVQRAGCGDSSGPLGSLKSMAFEMPMCGAKTSFDSCNKGAQRSCTRAGVNPLNLSSYHVSTLMLPFIDPPLRPILVCALQLACPAQLSQLIFIPYNYKGL